MKSASENMSAGREAEARIANSGLEPGLLLELDQAARHASENSYSPYSKFSVGAAVLTDSGRIFSGCNIENASYGLTNCAERTAIFAAVAAGECSVRAMVVYTPTDYTTAPCGACRQVIHEFGPECLVISICRDPRQKSVATAAQLLPGAFGPKSLGK